ncbi:MAG: hypothetical protein KDD66_08965 [Bdellovibrionales bacterium]|nr:hypothetical protein [Bdellovibrionales bacterium]
MAENLKFVSGDEQRSEPAMTAGQRRLTTGSQGQFSAYRKLMVGEKGLFSLAGFELYNLLLAPLPSGLGLALRQAALRAFLKDAGRGIVVGRSVTIRNPAAISIGPKAVIDDYATLESRVDEDAECQSSIAIGRNVFIGKHTIILAKPGSIVLGDACNISSHCRIATQSRVEIGNSVLIAAYAYIGPGNHIIEDTEKPIMEQGMAHGRGVKIGDNVWIGTRATVLDGVTVGSGAVIGAHSLVAQDVPENAIVAGTPAKIIRYRS